MNQPFLNVNLKTLPLKLLVVSIVTLFSIVLFPKNDLHALNSSSSAQAVAANSTIVPIISYLLLKKLKEANFEAVYDSYSIHDNPARGQFAFVDGDAFIDIIVGGVGDPNDFTSDSVTFIPGLGDGTFDTGSALTTVTGAYKSRGFIAADLNNDTFIDIITASPGKNIEIGPNAPPPNGEEIRVIYGNNDGTFNVGSTLVFGGYPEVRGIIATDVDNDTDIDLVISFYDLGSVGGDKIGVLKNNGSPGYGFTAPAVEYASGEEPKYLASGDLNNDGWVDFAVPSQDSAGSVYFHINPKDGNLAAGVAIVVGHKSEHAHIADINNDGNNDIIVSHANEVTDIPTGGFSVIKGNGDGTFQTPESYMNIGDGANLVTGDFNLDGRTDIAVGLFDEDLIKIMLNEGGGTFIEGNSLNTYHISGLSVADVNGDGRLDLLSTAFREGPGRVFVHLATQ